MKTLLATTMLVMAVAIAPAFAGPLVDNSVHNSASAGASASSFSSASAGASARQRQGQIQGQIGIQTNRQTNRQRQANSQTTIYEDQRPSGMAPSIGLGGFASGPCVGVTTQGGFGVGLPGGAAFGGSAGRSELDDECTRRETARILHSMGQRDLAIKVMMASPTVQAVLDPPKAAATAPIAATTASNSGKDARCASRWISDLGKKDLGC